KLVHVQPESAIRTSLGPPAEAPGGQALLAEPEALAIVDKHLQSRASPVPKNEHCAAHRVSLEGFAAEPTEPIHSIPEVCRLHGHEDPHLRRQLDHPCLPQNASLSRINASTLVSRT